MTKVLLVDDSPMDRRIMSEILQADSALQIDSCEDGEAALAAMARDLPSIVLTDMQMPVMDGLELVKRVRSQYPQVPIVLITGHGSEALATKTLRAGAAGYVPKSRLNEQLLETVRHVLQLVKTSEEDQRIAAATTSIRYEWKLPNDETYIPGLLHTARQRISEGCSGDDNEILQLEVAVENAILNAIYHGNLQLTDDLKNEGFDRRAAAARRSQQDPYQDRHVHVSMLLGDCEARFVIRDDGAGFNVKEVSSLGLTQSLRGDFGRGLFLMWAFMDKVVFDKSGNSVTLIKRFTPKQPCAAPVAEPAKETPRTVYASLRPKSGGPPIDLTQQRVTLGRDPSCDVVIQSPGVSHHHCLLFIHEGWWFVRDLKSKNGISVNGHPKTQHLLPPAAVLSVAKYEFIVEYQPHKLGAVGITPPVDPF